MSRRGGRGWSAANGKLTIPEWYSSASEPADALREAVIEASYAHVGTNLSVPVDTSDLRVGIADSAASPPEGFSADVGSCIECRPEGVRDTGHDPLHGHTVTRILVQGAPGATYCFYHTIPGIEDAAKEYEPGDLLPAIRQAVDDSIDLLNISAGVDGKYSARLSYERAVQRAAESGVLIVAAAGNEETVDRLCYPARMPQVVAVGGCVVRCQRPKVDEHLNDKRIWTRSPERHDGPYCSSQGCSERHECDQRYQQSSWWVGNVESHGRKPDVVAPCYSILDEQYTETAKDGYGTSFAAPVVSGSLVRLLSSGTLSADDTDLIGTLRAEGTDLGMSHEHRHQRIMFRNPR